MAVGKGSMKRAAKTAEKTQKAVVKKAEIKLKDGILERDAMPNERFSVGDAMPVYYF